MQVDLGNYFEPPGPRSQTVNDALVEALDRLPIRVLNLTSEDLFLWDELSRKNGPTRVVSTNLSPRDASRPAPARYVVVEAASPGGTVRIGFLGLADPARVKPNSGFQGRDPLQALAETIPEVASRADLVVVLTDLPEAGAAAVAQASDEIDVVLRAEPRFVLGRPQVVNKAVILSSVERGRYLGRLTLRLSADGKVDAAEPEFVNLDDKVPEDPYFLQLQRELDAKP